MIRTGWWLPVFGPETIAELEPLFRENRDGMSGANI